ncbi:efflux RND transporter periplasmic adaptor subunit [Lignipirellula cremea]|uniref:Macrolide transporter subunit MacA n=1 Tax=Lignipirellula cremea TaxID=2528010 RepID=A0A518DW98_9BACT|nr:HlyD family efflux transporter periplasmic adaptor subunit [Lignipirellula cremea]QDU96103.1 macrolide transporter subunit MacA [Lignipirellula cremea]
MYLPFAALLLSAAVAAPPGDDGIVSSITLERCLVAAIDEIDIPSQRAGVLRKLPHRLGAEVSKDDLLAEIELNDAKRRLAIAQFDLSAAEKEATDATRVTAAEYSAQVSTFEHQQMIEVSQRAEKAVSAIELKKAWLQMKHAELQVKLANRELLIAEHERDKKKAEVELASSDVAERTILAPRNGIIAQVYKDQGEWVQLGEPIVRFVPLERLRVEGFVSENAFTPSDVLGATATITVRFSGQRSVVIENCTISYAASEIEPNGDFRVWAEVDNHQITAAGKKFWVLLPGMTASMTLEINARQLPLPAELRFDQSASPR